MKLPAVSISRWAINSDGDVYRLDGYVGIGTDNPGGLIGLNDPNTYIDVDPNTGEITFSDAVNGIRKLSELGGANTAEQEHYNEQSIINQTIIQSLDGYASDITVSEHKAQFSESLQHIFVALDAYGAGGTEQEHYNQQQQINQTIIQSLDGYVLVPPTGSGADGYVAFFVSGNAVAGDNDLFWDRENNKLILGGAADIAGQATLTSGFISASNGYFGTSNSSAISPRFSETQLTFYLSSSLGRTLVLADQTHLNLSPNWGHGVVANPTLFIHSNISPSVDTSQWISMTHDQTDGYIQTGVGSIRLSPTSNIVKIDGYMLPTVDDAYGLGNEEYRWRDLYLGPGSLHIRTDATQNDSGVARDWVIGSVADGSLAVRSAGGTKMAFNPNTNTVGIVGNISSRAVGGASGSEQFGEGAIASNTNTTAVGQGAIASGSSSTAVGTVALASAFGGTALGQDARATGGDGVAIGRASDADSNGVGIGGNAFAGSGDVVIGSAASSSVADTVAVGRGTRADAINTVALGAFAYAAPGSAGSTGTIAIGYGAISGNSASRTDAITIGRASIANGVRSITIGATAETNATDSIVIGHGAISSFSNSFAIGGNSSTTMIDQGVFGHPLAPINLVNFGSLALGTPTTATTFKLEVAGDVGPHIDDAYSLGSETRRWKDGYFGPGTIRLIQNISENDTGVNREWGLGINSSGDLTIRQSTDNKLTIQNDGNVKTHGPLTVQGSQSYIALQQSETPEFIDGYGVLFVENNLIHSLLYRDGYDGDIHSVLTQYAEEYLTTPSSMVFGGGDINTWTKLGGATSSGEVYGSLLVGSGQSIAYVGPTSLVFSISVTLTASSDTNNTTMKFALAKNGVILDRSIFNTTRIDSNDTSGIVIQTLTRLTSGDELEVYMQSDTAATITVPNMSIIMHSL